MLYIAQFMEPRRWTPGTVLTIPSDFPPFVHFVMVEFVDFHTATEVAIHSMPDSGVTRASLNQAIGMKPVSVYWTPQTPEDGEAAIFRMWELIGRPYHLTQANCEHVIRWAITGEWKSDQVSAVGIGLLVAGAIAIAASA